jgi:hypothetical protein
VTAPIALLQLAEREPPGLVGEIVASRRRSVQVGEVDRGADVPRDPATVRAVVVLPGPTEAAEPGVGDLVRACAHAGVPVLGLGVSAAIVAEDAGIGKADVRREPALTRVTTTPDAGDDPLAGAMPDEALWFTDVRVSWEVSAGAMALPVIPFILLAWLDVIKGAQCGLYCLSTVVAMLALMLYRRAEYAGIPAAA